MVEMWSFSSAEQMKDREQYSHTYNFCAWSHAVNKAVVDIALQLHPVQTR